MDSTVNTKLQTKSPEIHTVMKRQYAAEVPELYIFKFVEIHIFVSY